MNRLLLFFLLMHFLPSQLLGGQNSLSPQRIEEIITSDPGFQLAFAKVKETIAGLCEIDLGRITSLSYAMETGPTYEIQIDTLIGCVEVVVNVRFWVSQVKISKIDFISSKLVKITKQKIQKQNFLISSPNFKANDLPASFFIAGEPKISTGNNYRFRQNLNKNTEQKFGSFRSTCQFRKKQLLKAIIELSNGLEQSNNQIQNNKQERTLLNIHIDEQNNYISQKKSNLSQAEQQNMLGQAPLSAEQKSSSGGQTKNQLKLLPSNNIYGALPSKLNY